MGFRYRRSIRLARGIRINLSKSGPSLSIGQRGATMNFGPRGTRLTLGIPGTGLSYQTSTGRIVTKQTRTNPSVGVVGIPGKSRRLGWLAVASLVVIVCLIVLANGGSGTGTSSPMAVDILQTTAVPSQDTEAPKALKETVEVLAPANIRAAPRLDADVVGVAARHAHYLVFERSGGWTQVGIDHAQGWIGNSRLAMRPG